MMAKSPVYPKYETPDYDAFDFDPEVDFSQVMDWSYCFSLVGYIFMSFFVDSAVDISGFSLLITVLEWSKTTQDRLELFGFLPERETRRDEEIWQQERLQEVMEEFPSVLVEIRKEGQASSRADS